MASYRRLKSGKWEATVWLPGRQRRYRTDRLKSVVQAWAEQLEADIRQGDWIDPRAGEVTIGELWPRVRSTRSLELASRKRDDSHWRNHVEPVWRRTPLGAILRPDVRAWVAQMQRNGTGAATVEGALGVLRAVLEYAVDARMIRDNPARGVRAPRRDAHQDRVLHDDEDDTLLRAVDQVTSGPEGRLLIELMLYAGLRWEEAAALRRERVRLRDQLIDVGPVVQRDGSIREYPKTKAGQRLVPVPDHLLPLLRERVMAVPSGGLVVTARRGGVVLYTNWRRRVWVPSVRVAELDPPAPTPHDLRHTYGTRLGEAGVPVHEIMALMGHDILASAQRYLHAAPDRFGRARAAVARRRGDRYSSAHGADTVTHSGTP